MQTHRRNASRMIEPQDFLLPEARRKPVAVTPRLAEIEDAEFEVVGSAFRQAAPLNDNPPRPAPSSSPLLVARLGHIAGLGAARLERHLATLSPQAFMTLLSSLFLAVFWLCGGFSALGGSLPSASVPTFDMVDVSIASDTVNGRPVVAVSGILANRSDRPATPPRLHVVAADGTRIGTIRMDAAAVGAGSEIGFSGRFQHAGGKSDDIAIIPATR